MVEIPGKYMGIAKISAYTQCNENTEYRQTPLLLCGAAARDSLSLSSPAEKKDRARALAGEKAGGRIGCA